MPDSRPPSTTRPVITSAFVRIASAVMPAAFGISARVKRCQSGSVRPIGPARRRARRANHRAVAEPKIQDVAVPISGEIAVMPAIQSSTNASGRETPTTIYASGVAAELALRLELSLRQKERSDSGDHEYGGERLLRWKSRCHQSDQNHQGADNEHADCSDDDRGAEHPGEDRIGRVSAIGTRK